MAPLPSSTLLLTTETPLSSSKSPSVADRTDQVLKSLDSEHPLVKPLFFLQSQFRNFFQVHFRIRRVPHSRLVPTHKFAAILPGDSVAGLVVANGINNFLNIYNTLLVVRLVLTWFPNSPPAIVSPLRNLHLFSWKILIYYKDTGNARTEQRRTCLSIRNLDRSQVWFSDPSTFQCMFISKNFIPHDVHLSPSFSTICDPYLNIFRGIIPPLGGTLDLSPILAFLVLNAFTSAAAALPAELPASQNHVPPHATLQDLTAAREKWVRRLSSKRVSQD